MKVATYTVRASQAQAISWNRAAAGEGYVSTGAWIAAAVDAYLKVRARAGLPIPLAWRLGSFSVWLDGGELVTVKGRLSPPFGSYAGTAAEPSTYASRHRYTLVYIPDSRVIATLRSYRQVQALASELAPVLIRGDPLPSPGAVVERHRREAV